MASTLEEKKQKSLVNSKPPQYSKNLRIKPLTWAKKPKEAKAKNSLKQIKKHKRIETHDYTCVYKRKKFSKKQSFECQAGYICQGGQVLFFMKGIR